MKEALRHRSSEADAAFIVLNLSNEANGKLLFLFFGNFFKAYVMD